MNEQACQWPGRCNRGALREVDTGPIGEPGRRWLCLWHAGRVWNARKQANREAGLCPCGAAVTPGMRTCARCRERGRWERAKSRRLAKLAGECGIVLPRQAGRRRAFFDAYRQAFHRCQRQARRAWRRYWHRARTYYPDDAAVARASATWEGQAVTCEAAYGVRGVVRVHGVPARGESSAIGERNDA